MLNSTAAVLLGALRTLRDDGPADPHAGVKNINYGGCGVIAAAVVYHILHGM